MDEAFYTISLQDLVPPHIAGVLTSRKRPSPTAEDLQHRFSLWSQRRAAAIQQRVAAARKHGSPRPATPTTTPSSPSRPEESLEAASKRRALFLQSIADKAKSLGAARIASCAARREHSILKYAQRLQTKLAAASEARTKLLQSRKTQAKTSRVKVHATRMRRRTSQELSAAVGQVLADRLETADNRRSAFQQSRVSAGRRLGTERVLAAQRRLVMRELSLQNRLSSKLIRSTAMRFAHLESIRMTALVMGSVRVQTARCRTLRRLTTALASSSARIWTAESRRAAKLESVVKTARRLGSDRVHSISHRREYGAQCQAAAVLARTCERVAAAMVSHAHHQAMRKAVAFRLGTAAVAQAQAARASLEATELQQMVAVLVGRQSAAAQRRQTLLGAKGRRVDVHQAAQRLANASTAAATKLSAKMKGAAVRHEEELARKASKGRCLGSGAVVGAKRRLKAATTATAKALQKKMETAAAGRVAALESTAEKGRMMGSMPVDLVRQWQAHKEEASKVRLQAKIRQSAARKAMVLRSLTAKASQSSQRVIAVSERLRLKAQAKEEKMIMKIRQSEAVRDRALSAVEARAKAMGSTRVEEARARRQAAIKAFISKAHARFQNAQKKQAEKLDTVRASASRKEKLEEAAARRERRLTSLAFQMKREQTKATARRVELLERRRQVAAKRRPSALLPVH